ncbi:DUF2235 domain-containing protein [Rhizobium brockwellii]|jgi:uncharacterized protein (DUF2235 family)|uniref:DUF2235 domain-containing protein n=1 Tax=Rhizobium brockwellii TaxID=3019932 RepID=UPI000522F583|nr:DUF2235 domain-containing protein [Rhizobium brockwellii]KPN22701.1 hypothetical protein KS05_31970 [Rhizobium brockwellii]QJX09979.1 DUF2235 domain-containing protein [Rhizobium brockwellii]
MGKNIVVLFDGTGNEIASDETNILRLARAVLNDGEKQIFFYDPGVGTQGAPSTDLMSRQELIKLLGLGIGIGVYDKIGAAYKFLMERYERGDRLYFFGFSRGAYIARALAGMVAKLGIMEKGRDNLIPYAVKLYADPRNLELARNFSDTFCKREADIEFLGLFDTVKSVFRFEPRVPQFTSVVLPRTFSNPAVRTLRHALAIDEKRRFFRTNMWKTEQSDSLSTDVKQVWFAGVHSDIGGGYPKAESGLSSFSLEWMLKEASIAGLLLDPSQTAVAAISASGSAGLFSQPLMKIHESLGGWWRLAEWFPKIATRGPLGKTRTRAYLPRGERRFIAEGSTIHQSVVDRRDAGVGYNPLNLPKAMSIEPY